MAKISIIVPFYNVQSYVDRCMTSLLNQTIGIENLELILVDDASTDDTANILRRYEERYPDQIILIVCEENGRQGAARNIGLQYATAPYIGFVDSDDWIELDMYEKMYDKIVQHDCDIVYCRHVRDNGKDTIFEKQTGKRDVLISIKDDGHRGEFLVSNVMGVGACDKLYKSELILENDIRFPEKLAYEDICFGAMFYIYAKKIYILEECLYHYFVNWNSTVLKMDEPYHYDIFTVNEMKWEEYETRGALKRFPMAVKYDFVRTYYLAGLKVLFLRYTKPSYEYFLHIKQRVWELTGDYKKNPYLKDAFTPIWQNLLLLLDADISEEEFWGLADAMKKIAGAKDDGNMF